MRSRRVLAMAGTGALLLAACGSRTAPAGSSTTRVATSTTSAATSTTSAATSTTTRPAPVTTTTPSSTTTTPSGSATNLPLSGTYVNGPSGTPHNYIVLSTSGTDSVSGTADFLYQDGRTTTEFSFAGTAISGTAQLQSQEGGPGSFTATYTATTMTLQGCAAYLSFVSSSSQCLFTLSSSG